MHQPHERIAGLVSYLSLHETTLDYTTKRSPSFLWMKDGKPERGGGGASRRGSHKLADAGGCEVKFYWSHKIKAEKAKGRYYLDFGTLFHTALAYHYGPKMQRTPQWLVDCPDRESAMEEDSKGNPEWYRRAKEIMQAYEAHYAGEPWEPIYCEEEFETTLGVIDPDGEDEPPVHLERTNPDDPEGPPLVLDLPSLNEEIVTCRPDLIVTYNGYNWLVDHKTAGAARDGSQRLPVIDERRLDYKYSWQAMLNLWVVRQTLDIEGFIFNRVKRSPPYDFSRDVYPVPGRLYAKIPAVCRAVIKKERDLRIRIFNGGKIIPSPWECVTPFGNCDYVKLCHVDSKGDRDLSLLSDFRVGG